MKQLSTQEKLLPFVLSGVIILLDQLTKWLVVQNIPLYSVGASFGKGGILRIIHVQNKAIGFSIGHTLPDTMRMILFIIVPVIVIIGIMVYLVKSNELMKFQRWMIALILGGGIGNLLDRLFRPMGVVDFIDVKFYGIFGLERWPTFNLADSAIVVGGILLIASLILLVRSEHE